MAQRSSSDSIICSLNKKAMATIWFSTTQRIKTVTRSACANCVSILCRTSQFLAVEWGPGLGSARGRSSETTFVNKGLLKQCAKTTKLNTPSQVYCSLQEGGSYGRWRHQRCQTFRFAGESQCTTAFMERTERKAHGGSCKMMSERETRVRSRIQLCHFTPHEVFFSWAPPSLFF